MVHAMMNEFFSPSSFRRRMAALPPSLPPRLFPSSPPSLPSLRKRLRQKQRRPARRKRERGREERLFSTRKERGRYRSSAAADADDGEGRREREGGAVVRFTRSVREATVPLIIANRAGAGGGALQMTGRPAPPSPSSLAWLFHLPDSSWGSC